MGKSRVRSLKFGGQSPNSSKQRAGCMWRAVTGASKPTSAHDPRAPIRNHQLNWCLRKLSTKTLPVHRGSVPTIVAGTHRCHPAGKQTKSETQPQVLLKVPSWVQRCVSWSEKCNHMSAICSKPVCSNRVQSLCHMGRVFVVVWRQGALIRSQMRP